MCFGVCYIWDDVRLKQIISRVLTLNGGKKPLFLPTAKPSAVEILRRWRFSNCSPASWLVFCMNRRSSLMVWCRSRGTRWPERAGARNYTERWEECFYAWFISLSIASNLFSNSEIKWRQLRYYLEILALGSLTFPYCVLSVWILAAMCNINKWERDQWLLFRPA